MNVALQTLKERTVASRKSAYMATMTETSAVGVIRCIVDFTKGNPRNFGSHISVRFELNGKRIKAADLSAMLDELR